MDIRKEGPHEVCHAALAPFAISGTAIVAEYKHQAKLLAKREDITYRYLMTPNPFRWGVVEENRHYLTEEQRYFVKCLTYSLSQLPFIPSFDIINREQVIFRLPSVHGVDERWLLIRDKPTADLFFKWFNILWDLPGNIRVTQENLEDVKREHESSRNRPQAGGAI